MIPSILEELRGIERQKNLRFIGKKENTFIAYLIYLKYLCDKKDYSYDDVIENERLYEIMPDIIRMNRYFLKEDKLPVNRILIQLRKYNIKDLLLEFLSYVHKPIYLHEDKDKIAYLNIESNLFSFYHEKGNATYYMKSIDASRYEIFKVFDEILGIHNDYVVDQELKVEDFNYVYIFDDIPRFRKNSNKENIFDQVRRYMLHNENVVLITNYNKISSFREGRFLARGIQTILLDHLNATIHFKDQSDKKEITIINHNQIKDSNQLKRIIKNNRKQKGVLLKITLDDLIENHYRIGFHLYELEKTHVIKDINKIVDENTYYLERLNHINEKVEKEINKLLNR